MPITHDRTHGTRPPPPSPLQQALPSLNPRLNNPEIEIPRKSVLVDAVQPPLPARRTEPLAPFDETSVRLFAPLAARGGDRVVVLGDVQVQVVG